MADLAPVAVSPLRTVTGAGGLDVGHEAPGVVLEDLSLLAKVLVRCDDLPAAAASLGTGHGRAARDGDRMVVGSGPGEWLLLGPEGSAPTLTAHAIDVLSDIAALTSVVDLTHGRALVRLRGPRVRDLLARLTAFDLDDRKVAVGAAWRTWVAGVVCDLVRDDVAGEASYLVHCERSSGRYLAETMLAAGADLGAVLAPGTAPPDLPRPPDAGQPERRA